MPIALLTMVSFSRFIRSSRGGQLLVDTDGYIYQQRNKMKSKTTYTCRRSIKNKKAVNLLLQCLALLLKRFFRIQ